MNAMSQAAAEFLTETGRLVEVHRGRAIVELEGSARPGSKPECARCGLCSAAGAGAGALPELRASVAPGLKLAPGDRVEIRLRLARPGRAGFLLLGLPLAAFLAGLFMANWLWKSEAAMMASSFGALGAAFLVLYAVGRRRGAMAEVVRRM
jgi:positive regulator of sigma E activity